MQTLERTGNASNDAGNRVPPITVPGNILDGWTKDVTLAVGVNSPDGKGNIEAYLGYRETDPVLENTRDYTACAIFTNNGDGKHYCGGSSNSPQGKFTKREHRRRGDPVRLAGRPDGGQPRPPITTRLTTICRLPSERYSAGYFAHYDLTPHIELYSNLMFSDNHEFAQIAPSGIFYGVPYQVNCNNPYLLAAGALAPELCAGAVNNETTLYIGRRTARTWRTAPTIFVTSPIG